MTWTRMVRRWAAGLALIPLMTGAASGQTGGTNAKTGREIFRVTCAACHGADGRGAPDALRGFEPPPTFPDFTNCRPTAREPDPFWSAIIHNGGPDRGFSEIMPAFRETLTREEIEAVLEYAHSLCREPAWPRGNLNFPRALITEKAFPEDEFVLDAAAPPWTARSFRNPIAMKATATTVPNMMSGFFMVRSPAQSGLQECYPFREPRHSGRSP